MNPYQNKNEYEIVDAPQNYDNISNKYPYANDSNIKMKNTNYKDWLVMCNQNQQYSGSSENFASPETITAVSTGLIVVGTMLGAFAAPVTPAILISFGTILSAYWKPGTTDDPIEIWEGLLTIGTRPFNQPIDKNILHIMSQIASSYRPLLNQFESYFNIWKNNRNAANARAVQTAFTSTHLDMLKDLARLTGNYKIPALPFFAQLANWHLNLLKYAAEYYDEWEKDQRVLSRQSASSESCIGGRECACEKNCEPPGTIISSKYYTCILKCRIADYTDYCTTTYNTGLNMIKTNSSATWKTFNTYRREMTLTVLDIIALFPIYDPDNYKMGVISELTRETYTDLDAPGFSNEISLKDLENQLTNQPKLFTWLINIILYKENTYFSGIVNSKNYTLSSSNPFSQSYGRLTGTSEVKYIFPTQPVSQMKITRGAQDLGLPFGKLYNLIQKITFIESINSQPIPSEFKVNNQTEPQTTTLYEIPKHRLSHFPIILHPLGISNYFLSISTLGWTHESVNPNNTISTNRITQIPAVKAFQISSDSKVVKGPDHTGGDLVILKNSMDFNMTFSRVSQRYKVRVRYAKSTTSVRNLTLEIGNNKLTIELRGFSESTDYENLKYKDFYYATSIQEFSYTPSSQISTAVRLSGLPNDLYNIWIDKIEFIPVNNFTNNESLEKAKKSVDHLFINKYAERL